MKAFFYFRVWKNKSLIPFVVMMLGAAVFMVSRHFESVHDIGLAMHVLCNTYAVLLFRKVMSYRKVRYAEIAEEGRQAGLRGSQEQANPYHERWQRDEFLIWLAAWQGSNFAKRSK